MTDSNMPIVAAGLLAYLVAFALGTGPLIYVTLLVDEALTKRIDEYQEINDGNLPVAIELGATVVCQAILIRHAVYASMAILRTLFVPELPPAQWAAIFFRSGICALIIVLLGLGSVYISGSIFKKFSKKRLDVEAGIREKRNLAMAVFYAFVLVAITATLNEGVDDFSRSLIPYGRTGIIDLQ